MKKLNCENAGLMEQKPIKVVQFGEGNFLRAFVDYALYKINQNTDFNAGVAVVQPIDKGLVNVLNEQDGLYHLFLNGIENGKEIQEVYLVDNIVKALDPYADFDNFLALAREPELKVVISNTTEAGITYVGFDRVDDRPPSSFPAKLTVFLLERFKHFDGDPAKGLEIIPCELINYNAENLKLLIFKYCEEWNLENDFIQWIQHCLNFHNTLVDRIVPGYPADQAESLKKDIGYDDKLMVTAEPFFLWVIEGDSQLNQVIPFDKSGLDVKVVENMQPYRTRKVRILNGAHTSMVPFSLLYGNSTVEETIEDDFTGEFIQKLVYEEIIPTLDMDKNELESFAHAVFDRFRNPFVKHQLASIALNSVSKFKVRVLPSLLAYQQTNNELPMRLTFALACLIRFYKGSWNDKVLPVNDNHTIMIHWESLWQSGDHQTITHDILSKPEYWDQDLTRVPGLQQTVINALDKIETLGIKEGYAAFAAEFVSTNQNS